MCNIFLHTFSSSNARPQDSSVDKTLQRRRSKERDSKQDLEHRGNTSYRNPEKKSNDRNDSTRKDSKNSERAYNNKNERSRETRSDRQHSWSDSRHGNGSHGDGNNRAASDSRNRDRKPNEARDDNRTTNREPENRNFDKRVSKINNSSARGETRTDRDDKNSSSVGLNKKNRPIDFRDYLNDAKKDDKIFSSASSGSRSDRDSSDSDSKLRDNKFQQNLLLHLLFPPAFLDEKGFTVV